jgi:uroporphyrinogen decarboxylase
VNAIVESLGGEYALRVGGGSLGVPLGSKTWLHAIIARPDLVSRLFDVQAESAVRSFVPLSQVGAKLIFGGGDLASGHGPFYSPGSFRELMLPRLRRIAEACHARDMFYLFASDGNLWPIADDLFGKSGVDGFYEIDRRAGMDLGKLRARYPGLTCIGNISSYTLHRGTAEEVAAETKSCIEEAKRNNGIIVGVSNQITSLTPRENIFAMLDTIRQLRKA